MNRAYNNWRNVVLAASLVVASAEVLAHDLWIEPSAFVIGAGNPITVRLRVGVNLLGDPIARDPALIERFITVDEEGIRPMPGRDGLDPAGILRTTAPGLTIIGYASKPSRIALTAQKFNEYLVEEGLEPIAALRQRRNETSAEAREEFARCAKALLSTGPLKPGQGDKALGFTLELVAEKNPYALRPGQDLPVRLLYQGKPLPGALVIAINKRNPSAKVSARSGADGRVALRLAEPGMWLVKAVHMIAAPAGSDAQWASFWASLTFQLPDTGSTPGSGL